ncbi:RING-H2 finger protein ATL56-like [Cucurbita pepo subsp. pepo]|uniref:RING-H2 finger protein ATL56-like n=1 Tax=Cucurbita pepo subsp. pepo TaxID=3664 RepID=UPI000C9D912C|nr:RING-H2 finger protein ATL56-like [Cucurbita pepo subsp. pepo]
MPLQDSTAAIAGDPPPPKPEAKVLSLLLKVSIMIVLTTLFFVFLGLATALLLIYPCVASVLHRRRRRRHRRRSQFTDSSSGFSNRDLKKLLQFRFSNWVNPHSQIDCPICLGGFRKGQWCRKLGGCGHIYHRKCIDSWLVRVSACPLCRSSVRLDMEENQMDCANSRSYEILYAP